MTIGLNNNASEAFKYSFNAARLNGVDGICYDFTPTAVTIGKVDLQAIDVDLFLAGLDLKQQDTNALMVLLNTWAPAQAAGVSDTDRTGILAALRAYLDPDRDDQLAVLHWDTLEERGTIGFYVERRLAQGNWERINQKLLPGLITAPMGGEYQLADPTARGGEYYQYRLIELEAHGNEQTYGSFSVEINK